MPDFGGGDTFSTYLYASRKHPNMELRKRLFEATTEWVDNAIPDYSSEQICEVISQERGTILEPFELSPSDVELAAMLMKMAFSKIYRQTRFRIVSRETIGSCGGLVFTNNLKSYYVERYARGINRSDPLNAWTFAPANEPTPREVAKLARPKIDAKLKFSDNGIFIEIGIPALAVMKWKDKNAVIDEDRGLPPSSRKEYSHTGLIRNIVANSTIGPKRDLLGDLGLRVDLAENKIVIAPKSSGSVIRFTAHLMKNSVIQLDPGDSYPGRMKLLIGLSPPDKSHIDLEYTTVLTEGVLGDWIDMEIDRGPYIEKQDRIDILEWLTSKPENQSLKEYLI
jgi:hypothetical protein